MLLMTVMAIADMLGVGSIMPFLTVLGNPEMIHSNQYLHTIYNYFGFTENNSFLIFLGISALFVLLLTAFIKSVSNYAQFRFVNMRRHSIGQKLLKKYLRQPYEFFLNRNSSDISKTILSETDQAITQAIQPAFKLLSHLTVAIFLIALLIAVDPFFAFILTIIFGGFYTFIYWAIRKYLTKIGVLRAKVNTSRFKIAQEIIGGIKDLKILGRENAYLDRFVRPSFEFSSYAASNASLAQIPQFLVEVIAFGTLLVMAMYALTSEGANLGQLLPILGLYTLGALKLKPAFSAIFSSLTMMKFGASALETIIKDLHDSDETKHVEIRNDNKRIPLTNELVLKNITFRYNGTSTKALNNININIKAYTSVGIIGTTGAGKSTLVDIILGLLTPTNGIITLDGTPLTKQNTRQWQNSIGYVPQNIFLADDTIANNIAFGVEQDKLNIDQVCKAAKMAQVDEFIISLENGYDTIIGERGVRLSGGQRQRLGIARALYHEPELLLLDEATSALDNQTEAAVMQAIESMSGNKTVIMIAHRLSTIEKCDVVIKLEKGKIQNA